MLIPKENQKDIREIPMKIRRELQIIPVDHVDEVLRVALVLSDPDGFFRQQAPGAATGSPPAPPA